MVFGFFGGLGLAVTVLIVYGCIATGKRADGSWWLVTGIGVDFGPFPTRERAEQYPHTFMGILADAPAFRNGWHVEQRVAK